MHSTAEFLFLSLLGLKIVRGGQNVVILFDRQPGTGIEGNEADTEAKWQRKAGGNTIIHNPPPPKVTSSSSKPEHAPKVTAANPMKMT
jgi:hypothetical protein